MIEAAAFTQTGSRRERDPETFHRESKQQQKLSMLRLITQRLPTTQRTTGTRKFSFLDLPPYPYFTSPWNFYIPETKGNDRHGLFSKPKKKQ